VWLKVSHSGIKGTLAWPIQGKFMHNAWPNVNGRKDMCQLPMPDLSFDRALSPLGFNFTSKHYYICRVKYN
jgi:hypothetical protein